MTERRVESIHVVEKCQERMWLLRRKKTELDEGL